MSDNPHRTALNAPRHPGETALPVGAPGRTAFLHHHVADYLPGAPQIPLWVVAERDVRGRLRIAAQPVGAEVSCPVPAERGVAGFAAQFAVPVIDLSAPLPLDPVVIPKPWGRELWFTGVEARGQSGVRGEGGSLPLPWLLSIVPDEILGNSRRKLNLLKILDPLPDPLYGDLYFELHEEKREVYVVTRVDPASWPAGRGAIRYGFDAGVRAAYPDDQAFRVAYLRVVQAYERVRRQIERQEAEWRRAEGWGPQDPVPAATLRRWRAALAPELRRAEVEARAAMERFTRLLPIGVGDVVQVPTLLPHALQHGVRTVEFQTPVYERRIISFAQQVLTQDHWDTELAVRQMRLDPPPQAAMEVVGESPGVTRERIVAFDDFLVDRWTLQPGASVALQPQGAYALVMAIGGDIRVAGVVLAAEHALLLPASCAAVGVENGGSEPALLLVSRPVGGS